MAKDTVFHKKATLNAGGRLIDLSTPQIMGIINLTPDSFYGGSRQPAVADALQQAEKMLAAGAAFLDLGAYSSRPGAADISVQEETERLLPVVEALADGFPEAVLSIDTFRAQVAEAAVRSGAHIINDISGGQLDTDMFATVARLKVPYVLMHMKGTPQTMNGLADYDDVFNEVLDYFTERYQQLKNLGVADVILDPGFGFAKKPVQSYALLNRLEEFNRLELPLLVGVSRKKMIYNLLGITADDALNGTTVINTIALTKGADILRVHDVKQAIEAVKLWEAVNQLHPL
ncbi:dihydropteroate synthase [Mucilaginibacter sp. UR6-11]|uniref:dihydropteroate synthase n=1 Tax=Mucilaginibacter sp. UR6-11 TaxID=1435644 RepID=UPI001E5E1F80|nr:dihydropteroate synthase [Mucilaginibacter sp. UR6-11]MCC8424652.1 dihydropteroate synthase [Mucilaginibacter sp. UR6-11]